MRSHWHEKRSIVVGGSMEQITCKNLAIGYDGKVLLKDINFSVKSGDYLCIIGENGSGKSTLVNEILYKTLRNNLYKAKEKPGKCKKVTGIENIDKVINISQDPIGKSPRSNPATYVGVFDDIRDLFSKTNEAFYKAWGKTFPQKRSELLSVLEQCTEAELKGIREALYNDDYPNSFPENTNDSEAWTAISANYMEYSLCFPKN